jgi:hypothetical protein
MKISKEKFFNQNAIFFETNIFRTARFGFWYKGVRPWFMIENQRAGFEIDLWRFSFAYLKKQSVNINE